MSVNYDALREAVQVRDIILDDVYTQSIKGNFDIYYDFKTSPSSIDKFDIKNRVVRDFIGVYFINNGYYYNYADDFGISIGWDYGDIEDESKYYFDIARRAMDIKCDFTNLMLEGIAQAVCDKSAVWEVILDYDFINRQSDTVFWLANETKRYCDEHDDFFNCKVEERYHELVLVFTDGKEQ